ncbi:MAG: hypothetical protein PHN56_01855, partial [Candidatus Nanoarchaeia archaeon]|nr:hypothetical protein [Candidatus Nanoarchaeia archaeon]
KKRLKALRKSPKGLAAASIYVSAERAGIKKTQGEIVSQAKITEVTLRKYYQKIKKILDNHIINLS